METYKINFTRKAGLFLLISLFFIGACNNVSRKPAEIDKPQDTNLVMIVIDDLNNTLGTYGHSTVITPNIDRLADRGMQFNNAYCNFAVCGPSRGSFLTGLLPESIGILDNRTPLQPLLGDMATLPYLFKQNGFQTIGLGKVFHGRNNGHGDAKAWDEYYTFETTELGQKGEKRNMTDGVLPWCEWQAAEGDDEDQEDGQMAAKAVEFIKRNHEKPYFMAVGLKKPHDPFIAPKKYFDMYPLEDCDPPELPEGWEPPYPFSLPGETKVFNKFTDNDKREFLRSYYACTSFMDAQVGKIVDALEETGQLENTLIMFFGDHGYHLGEHNWWNKVTIYEKGTNAPLIMAGNSVAEKGTTTEAMVEFIDFYPTLAELFNLDNVPAYLEGKSFTEILGNPDSTFRTEVRAITRRGEMFGRMVKNEHWRYIEWGEDAQGVELYDQKNDPIEYHNLAFDPDYAGVVEEMKGLLISKKTQ